MATSKKQPLVQFKGIMKQYGKVTAVEKMDFDIEEGSLVTLLGPSGCGKTTLLRMVAGLEDPTEGDIYIKGVRINDTPIHKRNLGMIFQNYALFPHKTIFDNVAFGLKYRNVSKDQIREKVMQALEMVRLPGVENRMPSQLSGGQQQRIAMARAIVIEPDVLLMDEPLSALDENLREEMRREVDNLQQMLGVTTIFVTHDQREALSMSDKILVMKAGRKQQEGDPQTVYNQPVNHFVADFLGHSNFIKGQIVDVNKEHVHVQIETGDLLIADNKNTFNLGDRVELVVRAQRFDLVDEDEITTKQEMNSFAGRIKDRSYMGGEVSYFIELGTGREIHIISMMRTRIYSIGEKVRVQVAPHHCHLLAIES
ncbi:ABC transporter ATP-binding protein [Desulfopila sp. IMCC35006]|uniref:ABC transporter ATP-binding protein n=1 Tax=Desulfopila sp. IMCC35006 TaxID=2569542 RepID=UPI0010AD042E|nr:ABC transporter ATP-binding protein [Desulfopila sp. IMCC35006]TKB24421.1 ABC transporter ATP-binding protein [Desulfopila sp. IMCC35006]